jgi:hypothetical protein
LKSRNERHTGVAKEIVPEYDFGEVHAVRLAAPPEKVLSAVKVVRLGEMPLVRVLFAVRSIPARVGGRGVFRRMRGSPFTDSCWISGSYRSARSRVASW